MNLPCEGGPTTSWYACAPLQRQRWRSRALFCGRAASCSSSPQAPQRLAAGVSLAPTPAAANLARERSSRRYSRPRSVKPIAADRLSFPELESNSRRSPGQSVAPLRRPEFCKRRACGELFNIKPAPLFFNAHLQPPPSGLIIEAGNRVFRASYAIRKEDYAASFIYFFLAHVSLCARSANCNISLGKWNGRRSERLACHCRDGHDHQHRAKPDLARGDECPRALPLSLCCSGYVRSASI